MQNKTIQDVISCIRRRKRWTDTRLVTKAYQYAVENHGQQCRKSGEPYIIHPIQVAYILAEIGLDVPTICAALLHDVVEDTSVTHEDIVREFGKEIAQNGRWSNEVGKTTIYFSRRTASRRLS